MTDPDPTVPPTPEPSGDPDKTFTQADVDRIVADRLKRARSEPPADYDELKNKAAELDKLKAAQLSETERLQKAVETAERKAKEATDRATGALRRAAVVAAAQRAGAVDPDAVLAMLAPDSVTVGDDGQVTGAEEAVKALLEAKQYLVGKPSTPTPGGADGGPRPSTPTDVDAMSMEQYIAARKSGQIS